MKEGLQETYLIHEMHESVTQGGKKGRQKISLAPIIRYLEDQNKPVTQNLREWLANLMKGAARAPFRIVAQRKRGRQQTFDLAVYHCVNELDGQEITRALSQQIAKSIKGAKVRPQQRRGRVTYIVGPLPKRGDTDRTEFSLANGKKISKEVAFDITSARLNRSRSSVKKVWRAFATAALAARD